MINVLTIKKDEFRKFDNSILVSDTVPKGLVFKKLKFKPARCKVKNVKRKTYDQKRKKVF